MQELFQLLSRRETEDILKCLDEFTTLLEQDNRYDVDYVRTIFLQIAFSISNTLDCRSGERPLKTMNVIQEEIQQISSLHDLIQWLHKYAQSCISRSRSGFPAAFCPGKASARFFKYELHEADLPWRRSGRCRHF